MTSLAALVPKVNGPTRDAPCQGTNRDQGCSWPEIEKKSTRLCKKSLLLHFPSKPVPQASKQCLSRQAGTAVIKCK